MRKLLLIIFSLLIIGCSAVATRFEFPEGKKVIVEKMKLSGFGARKAVFENGSSIEKDTTLKVPDILPTNR